ncbi:hypothetical protein ATY41_01030 [Leifsonia xyli subsp. xyli]|uniref:Uncharacterized protein n=1 Tax=Leifsonia xyli subsp. xyli TaxID=59736 RepID=A0A1E2SNI9_LEIXY|nr:hypothetical protein [Leifsonia xyli]ODA91301.1 hypothetical protein ATY41_01030 [Leifsonia xyli subsp. xyli]
MPRNTWWSLLGLALILALVSLGLFLAPGLDQGVATRAVGHHDSLTRRQWIDLGVAIIGFTAAVCAATALFVTRRRLEEGIQATPVTRRRSQT